MLKKITEKYDNHWKTILSHVVGVLQIYYLLSCAGGWLSQHCCVVATVIRCKSHWCALINRANKGIAWVQARTCELERRVIQRKVKLLVKVFQYVELLKRIWLHVRKGEILTSVWGSKREIAQGRLPYGLLMLHNLVNFSVPLFLEH